MTAERETGLLSPIIIDTPSIMTKACFVIIRTYCHRTNLRLSLHSHCDERTIERIDRAIVALYFEANEFEALLFGEHSWIVG